MDLRHRQETGRLISIFPGASAQLGLSPPILRWLLSGDRVNQDLGSAGLAALLFLPFSWLKQKPERQLNHARIHSCAANHAKCRRREVRVRIRELWMI